MAIFSKNNKMELDQQVISTLISEGCILDGNMKAPAYARIDGQITGDVNVDGGLILGEKGVIKGNIVTKEMIVHGAVHGNINTYSLEIRNSGRITGDIKTEILQVETGGAHNGKLSMSASATQNNNNTRQMKIEAVAV